MKVSHEIIYFGSKFPWFKDFRAIKENNTASPASWHSNKSAKKGKTSRSNFVKLQMKGSVWIGTRYPVVLNPTCVCLTWRCSSFWLTEGKFVRTQAVLLGRLEERAVSLRLVSLCLSQPGSRSLKVSWCFCITHKSLFGVHVHSTSSSCVLVF